MPRLEIDDGHRGYGRLGARQNGLGMTAPPTYDYFF